MKPTLLALVLLGATQAGCTDALFERAQAANQPRHELLEDDAMHVVLCGTNAPLPNPERAESCTAVFAAGQMLLFDAGNGAQSRIGELRLPVDALEHIFLTHLHDDHIADVPQVIHRTWMLGRTTELTLHGPVGVSDIEKAHNLLYGLDRRYRVDHHGPEILDVRYDVPLVDEIVLTDPEARVPVYEKNGLVVSVFPVDHSPVSPAFGYRIDYRGRSIVISGDTIATAGLEKNAKDADVLVAEIMNKEFIEMAEERMAAAGRARNAKLLRDIRDYHVGPDALGALAERAGVKTLILTHLVPGVFNVDLINYFIFSRPVSRSFSGEIIVGKDGTEFELPLGG